MAATKHVHSIILDAGPILKNDPAVSSLLATSEKIYTIPAVLSEIKDANARSRVENTLKPFLEIRIPKPESIQSITNFARKTGDLAVLSKPDVQILALAYEIECERNGGDWRLRRMPGQKGLNGSPPSRKEATGPGLENVRKGVNTQVDVIPNSEHELPSSSNLICDEIHTMSDPGTNHHRQDEPSTLQIDCMTTQRDNVGLEPTAPRDINQESVDPISTDDVDDENETLDAESDESDGWITPSNLSRQQARDLETSTASTSESPIMQCATITTDFAMQNILLQINLNLLSTSLQRIRQLKTYILRCHACFQTCKDMTKQFCPRCGGATLTRVACSTNANGEFKLHLKKNMQWNTRGNRYSIPKPVPGTANGKVGTGKGGGKGGWGQELILAEDQKEYLRAMQGHDRRKEKNPMDEDYLPSILTGDRGRNGGRPRVGAGRNVNSKKR